MKVLGVDVGASGVRAAVARVEDSVPATLAHASGDIGTRISPGDGLDAAHLADRVAEVTARLPAGDIGAIALGCAGLMSMGDNVRAVLPAELARLVGAPLVALCSDTLTSYLGAVGWQPGVVVAAGTGAVTISADMRGLWRRTDGWGYLLGDDGGGAWIGRAGLNAGLRSLDGRPLSSAALAKRMGERFGDPLRFAGELARRDDRAAVVAGFAVDVFEAADAGDERAKQIRDEAARHLAESAAAALPSGGLVSLVGGLAAPLFDAFADALRSQRPDAVVRQAVGTGRDGAVLLAAYVLGGSLPDGAQALGAQLTRHGPAR